MRHTPPGGVVLLSADADDEVIIRVQGTGEGIAAADLSDIWDRCFRAADLRGLDPERADGREGAGLGLALVKELTEAMGGTVDIVSAPDKGSCFSVRLPVARWREPLVTAGRKADGMVKP